jgi:hypothetical protein
MGICERKETRRVRLELKKRVTRKQVTDEWAFLIRVSATLDVTAHVNGTCKRLKRTNRTLSNSMASPANIIFQCQFASSIWSIIQIASSLYPHAVSPIYSGIGFTGLITGLERLLGWERLLSYDRYGCVEFIKCLTIKILLLYRSSTSVPILFVYGRLFSGWRTVTCLWRSVRLETTTRDIFFQHGWQHTLRTGPPSL